MKKFQCVIIIVIALVSSFILSSTNIMGADIIASTEQVVFNDKKGSIEIYSNGRIEIKYKYGLRKVDMYYCEKGEKCDNNEYSVKHIMESSAEHPYKNETLDMKLYKFNANLDGDIEYRVRVEAYFGTSSSYSGTESVIGSFTVGAVQIADTKDYTINGKSSNGIKDSRISKLMDKATEIINTVVLPIIYGVTGLVLVIKGAILGIQIVKGADDPSIRREKVGALKWLIIGVAISLMATTIVGAITGFFKGTFGL
jgi:hypothetical protein